MLNLMFQLEPLNFQYLKFQYTANVGYFSQADRIEYYYSFWHHSRFSCRCMMFQKKYF